MLYLIAENFCSSTHTLVQPPPRLVREDAHAQPRGEVDEAQHGGHLGDVAQPPCSGTGVAFESKF